MAYYGTSMSMCHIKNRPLRQSNDQGCDHDWCFSEPATAKIIAIKRLTLGCSEACSQRCCSWLRMQRANEELVPASCARLVRRAISLDALLELPGVPELTLFGLSVRFCDSPLLACCNWDVLHVACFGTIM